jgi:hypothetical protein
LKLADCSIIGKVQVIPLDDDVKDAIGTDVERASMFMKVKVNGEVYYSQRYDRLKSRNSFTVCYEEDDAEKYGLVRYFLSIPGRVVAVVVPLSVSTPPHYPSQLNILNMRIIPVALSSTICAVPIKALVCKCVYVHCASGMFIVRKPNLLNLN